MRISDWSSDVCSSDLALHHRDNAVLGAGHVAALPELDAFALGDDVADRLGPGAAGVEGEGLAVEILPGLVLDRGDREEHQAGHLEHHLQRHLALLDDRIGGARSEEHTSELQSLMRISYAVFCLK